MNPSQRATADAQARQRLLVLTALRFSGIALVMVGFGIVRGLIALPWAVGALLAVAGILEFFFLPRFIARRWTAGSRQRR